MSGLDGESVGRGDGVIRCHLNAAELKEMGPTRMNFTNPGPFSGVADTGAEEESGVKTRPSMRNASYNRD